MSVSITLSEPNAVSITKEEISSVNLSNITPNVVTVSGVPIGSGDASYTHTQVTASDQWDVTHNLNKKPSVSILDSDGYQIFAIVHYINNNRVIIEFSVPLSGTAEFN
jgi:hypothetical protein